MQTGKSAGEGTLLPDAKTVKRKIRRRPVPTRRPLAVPPKSAQMALLVFCQLFRESAEMPFSEAVARMEGVRDLMAAGPELSRYRDALTAIIEAEAVLLDLCAAMDSI